MEIKMTHWTVYRVTETGHEDGETWTVDYSEKSEALEAKGRADEQGNEAHMKKLVFPIPTLSEATK